MNPRYQKMTIITIFHTTHPPKTLANIHQHTQHYTTLFSKKNLKKKHTPIASMGGTVYPYIYQKNQPFMDR